MLWPTVSRPISLGVGHPFGAHDQIFLFSFLLLNNCFALHLGAPSDEKTGSVICSAICQWSESRRLITIHYCLIWDYWVPYSSPLMTRRDYGGSILTRLHTGFTSTSKSKLLSYFMANGRSVSQYILVSSPLWDMQPNITSCRNVAVWKLRSYFDNFVFEVTLRLTVSQSVSQSVCLGIEHLCGTCYQILLPVGMLLSCFCEAPSLTRGRVCNLKCNYSMIRVAQNL
jgi:hypothetical protein